MVEIIFALNTMYVIYWLNGTIKSKKECIARIKKSLKLIFEGVKIDRK